MTVGARWFEEPKFREIVEPRNLCWNDPPNGELEKTFRPKQLELRDVLEMGDIGIKELSQLISKGALQMECFPSMVSSMVC